MEREKERWPLNSQTQSALFDEIFGDKCPIYREPSIVRLRLESLQVSRKFILIVLMLDGIPLRWRVTIVDMMSLEVTF